MPTELEKTLAAALRTRAAQVPHSPMPPLRRSPRTAHRRLLPVAAAVVAAAGIAGAVVALQPDEQPTPPPPAASVVPRPDPYTLRPGEVYYLRTVRGNPDSTRYTENELWQSPQRTGPWLARGVMGESLHDGRVVPSGDGKMIGESRGRCYPNRFATEIACTKPASWSEPTLDLLATAPRDPAALARKLRATAVADRQSLVDEGLLTPEAARSDKELGLTQMSYVQMALSGNGVPPALRAPLRAVVAALPGIEVVENAADRLGRRGTGYRLGDPRDDGMILIFDGDTFLGTHVEAWVHGVAPGLGAKPSRMLD